MLNGLKPNQYYEPPHWNYSRNSICRPLRQCGAPNDNLADAWTLSSYISSTNGITVGATKEAGEPNHGGNTGGSSVWLNWTAPANGPVGFDKQGSAFDTSRGIYTGNSVNALSLIVSNEDVNASAALLYSRVQFNAVAGQT